MSLEHGSAKDNQPSRRDILRTLLGGVAVTAGISNKAGEASARELNENEEYFDLIGIVELNFFEVEPFASVFSRLTPDQRGPLLEGFAKAMQQHGYSVNQIAAALKDVDNVAAEAFNSAFSIQRYDGFTKHELLSAYRGTFLSR